MSLRNEDMSDRELLLAIRHATGTQDFATSDDIARELGVLATRGRSPAARVASRLSWMRRNGLVASLDPTEVGRKANERLWLITSFGEQVLKGQLPAVVDRALSKAAPGDQVMIMRQLSRKAYVEGSFELSMAVRREWLHNSAQRRRG